jgi:hypothetical protein
VADDVNWDDDYEVDLEGSGSLLVFTVEGASSAFLVTAPDAGGIGHGSVQGRVTPLADATSTELVNAGTAALDEAADIADDTLTFDVDGGNYERFQDIALPFRVIIGTEQMLVTAVVDGATEDTWTVIRGINATTAVLHLDNAIFTHLVGPETDTFRVDDASAFAAGDILKVATGGAERLYVISRNETTDMIVVKRGYWGTTPVDIADNANLWDVIDDVKIHAAIAAANSDLRIIGQADQWPAGDTQDNRIPLVAADFA